MCHCTYIRSAPVLPMTSCFVPVGHKKQSMKKGERLEFRLTKLEKKQILPCLTDRNLQSDRNLKFRCNFQIRRMLSSMRFAFDDVFGILTFCVDFDPTVCQKASQGVCQTVPHKGARNSARKSVTKICDTFLGQVFN